MCDDICIEIEEIIENVEIIISDFSIYDIISPEPGNIAVPDENGKIFVPDTSTDQEPIIEPGTTSQYWRGDKTWQTLDKSSVGLSNVDNTSDANKPISNATQLALNSKENLSNKSTDVNLGTSDELYPTQNAVKEYVDNAIPNFTSSVRHNVKLSQSINKGQAVYVSSATGTNMLVSKASNLSESTSSKTLGLLVIGGVTNDIVQVVTEGLLEGLNTNGSNAGDPVWLGVDGNLIFGLTNKPHAPSHLVYLGVVTRVNQNNGEIFVHVQNGFEFEELHNVLLENKQNKQNIFWDATTSLWKNGYSWVYLAMNAKTDGIENPITNGYYLVYTLQGNTIYRYITTAEDANGYPNEDAFYATNTAGVLTNLIVKRE
jgi:hypothetical protein